MQRKKNDFVSAPLSFEDFEKAITTGLPDEAETRKKEAALKKAYQQQKRKNKKA
jgi:hypothetical protein